MITVRCLLLAAATSLLACSQGGEHGHDHAPGNTESPATRATGEATSAAPAHSSQMAQTQPAVALGTDDETTPWSCPMHPEVRSAEPGRCPKCGMFLTRQDDEHDHDHESGDEHGHEHEPGHEHGDGHEHEHEHEPGDEHDHEPGAE